MIDAGYGYAAPNVVAAGLVALGLDADARTGPCRTWPGARAHPRAGTLAGVTESAPRIPSEFRYWEAVNRPAVQRIRRLIRLVFRFDPQPDDEYVRRFATAYYDTDPVAEAFVADVYDTLGSRAGRDMLDQAINHGVDSVPDAPESMHVLFTEFEQDPPWLDKASVELGARVFRRWGTALFKFATATTLDMYTESSIAKPLALSGGYTSGRAQHRQLETIRFWIDVSEPGGLEPGGAGRATSMKVRVMHVFIRRRLLERPEWDSRRRGECRSASGDASLTLMGGSIVPGLGLWSIGHQTTRREIEALLHFWRYVGHLLGVQPDWYPVDVKQSLQLMYAVFVKRAYSAGADGAELIEAYLPAFALARRTAWNRPPAPRDRLPLAHRLHPLLDGAVAIQLARHAEALALGADAAAAGSVLLPVRARSAQR